MDGRALQDAAVGREPRAVARAVPAALGGVEVDLAAEVRADGRDGVQRAVLVAVASHLLAARPDDVALARPQVLDRPPARLGEPVADEVQAELHAVLDEPRR